MMQLATGPISLTANELKMVLFAIRGARPATITTLTKPELQGGSPLKGLKKLQRTNGIINFIYQNAMSRAQGEPFTAKPRSWGCRLLESSGRMLPLVDKERHDEPFVSLEDVQKIPADNLYLEMKVERELEAKYLLNDEEVPFEQVEPHLRPRRDRPVALRDFPLSNLQEVALNGNIFVLGNELTMRQLFPDAPKVQGEVVAI